MTIKRPGGFNITDRALEYASYEPGSRILDIGCGQGDTVNHINELGFMAEGIDINLSDIKTAKATYPDINVTYGDGSFLCDYKSSVFDGVIMECALTMIEHPSRTINEAYRVMREGGRLIITDLYEKNLRSDQVESRKIYDTGFVNYRFEGALYSKPLIRMLEDEVGFKVTSFEDRSCDLNSYLAQTIMNEGNLDGLCTDIKLEINGTRRNIGYFILVAQKLSVRSDRRKYET